MTSYRGSITGLRKFMASTIDNKAQATDSVRPTLWYFAPMVVLVIGVAAVMLMAWGYRLREMQRNNSMRIEVLMDVQIKAAEYHLWIEQAIAKDQSIDTNVIIAHISNAVGLVDALVNGGATEHGPVRAPFDDPAMLAKAAELKSLLEKFRDIGVSRLRIPEKSRPGSIADRVFDDTYKEILSDTSALEDMVEVVRAGSRVKTMRIYQGIFIGWVALVSVATAGMWSREKRRRAIKQALIEANEQLASQALELEEHRGRLSFLVEKRTAELMAANVLLQQQSAKRRRALEELADSEKHVRQLSARLINAQEEERRRIAGELHDELGQALNVIKLRLRVIANNLEKDPKTADEGFEELMEYLNLVIEDVRRLSLSLSPTILEDLGLSAALRWLVDNVSSRSDMNITYEIEEVDDLIPRENWIGVYRVVQEALTNVCKHSTAKNVSVTLHQEDGKVAAMVEDDGVGFDPAQAAGKDAPKRGLGLTTMSERLGVIGGTLKVTSREGKGTRVAFSLPAQ